MNKNSFALTNNTARYLTLKNNLIRALYVGSISKFQYSAIHISACHANAANSAVGGRTVYINLKFFRKMVFSHA